jgi:hypothetical protein
VQTTAATAVLLLVANFLRARTLLVVAIIQPCSGENDVYLCCQQASDISASASQWMLLVLHHSTPARHGTLLVDLVEERPGWNYTSQLFLARACSPFVVWRIRRSAMARCPRTASRTEVRYLILETLMNRHRHPYN